VYLLGDRQAVEGITGPRERFDRGDKGMGAISVPRKNLNPSPFLQMPDRVPAKSIDQCRKQLPQLVVSGWEINYGSILHVKAKNAF
jgi:hypothetical protein